MLIFVGKDKTTGKVTTIKDYLSFEVNLKMNDYSEGILKVPIDCIDDISGIGPCSTFYVQCTKSGNKILEGSIYGVYESGKEIMIVMRDYLWYSTRRVIRQKFNYTTTSTNQNNWAKAGDVVTDIFNHINGISALPFVLGDVFAETRLQTYEYNRGQSFFDILSDIAERSGAEFVIRNGELRFIIPSTLRPNGVGSLIDGNYVRSYYSPQFNNINDFSFGIDIETYCNTKFSLGNKLNDKERYITVFDTNGVPQQVLQSNGKREKCLTINTVGQDDCGLYECYFDNPEGHDLTTDQSINKYPIIDVNGFCDECDILPGDRKNTAIATKFNDYSFLSVFKSINIVCDGSGMNITYDIGSDQRKKRGLRGDFLDINRRLKRMSLSDSY